MPQKVKSSKLHSGYSTQGNWWFEAFDQKREGSCFQNYMSDIQFDGKLQRRPDKERSRRYSPQVTVSREELESISRGTLFRDVKEGPSVEEKTSPRFVRTYTCKNSANNPLIRMQIKPKVSSVVEYATTAKAARHKRLQSQCAPRDKLELLLKR